MRPLVVSCGIAALMLVSCGREGTPHGPPKAKSAVAPPVAGASPQAGSYSASQTMLVETPHGPPRVLPRTAYSSEPDLQAGINRAFTVGDPLRKCKLNQLKSFRSAETEMRSRSKRLNPAQRSDLEAWLTYIIYKVYPGEPAASIVPGKQSLPNVTLPGGEDFPIACVQ